MHTKTPSNLKAWPRLTPHASASPDDFQPKTMRLGMIEPTTKMVDPWQEKDPLK